MTRWLTLIKFEFQQLAMRRSFLGLALIVIALPLAGLVVDAGASSQAWAVQSIADATTIYGVPLMACVLATAATSRERGILTAPVTRMTLILVRFVVLLFIVGVLAVAVQTSAFVVRSALGDARTSEFAQARIYDGKYGVSTGGDILWLLKEREHHIDLTYDLVEPTADEGRELRIDFVLGPGNVARGEGEHRFLHVFRLEDGQWRELDELIVSGSRARTTLLVPEAGEFKLRIEPGRSDFALGLRKASVGVADVHSVSLFSGLILSLGVMFGSIVVISGGMMLGACFTRPTAFVFAFLLLSLGLLKGYFGLGSRIAFRDLLSDRVMDVIAGDKEPGEGRQQALLSWYPDLSFSRMRQAFESGETLEPEDAMESVSTIVIIGGVALFAAWLLVWRRDESL